jgi:hypothetical protein
MRDKIINKQRGLFNKNQRNFFFFLLKKIIWKKKKKKKKKNYFKINFRNYI